MADPLPWTTPAKPRSKDSILQEADSLRALARKARKLAKSVTDATDQEALERHIKELEANAIRLEKAAVDAKSG